MLLLIDNYDSFTYNLYQYLCELGAEVEVVRNDVASLDELIAMRHEGSGEPMSTVHRVAANQGHIDEDASGSGTVEPATDAPGPE